MKTEHEKQKDDKEQEKVKETLKKETKSKCAYVAIPCDLCSFKCKTASDYMKHIEEHGKSKPVSCNMCDFSTKSADILKKHVEKTHMTKVAEKVKNIQKSGYCVYWNRGHCNFDVNKCRYEHKDIPPCKFQERCKKPDCKFFHEYSLGRFPFLGSRSNQNLRPQHQQQYQQAFSHPRLHRMNNRF